MPPAVPATRAIIGLPGDVPVTPDADEARRWAVEELAKRIYHEEESLLERLWNAIFDFFRSFLQSVGGVLNETPPAVTIGFIVLVLLVAVALALWLGGRVQLARKRRVEQDAVLEHDDRTAVQLTRAADEAATAGDFHAAVLQRFRAIIRDLDERGLLEDRPGLTAREATRLASAALPHLTAEFSAAADLFCDARYGHREPTRDDDAALRDLAARAAAGARTASTPAGVAAGGTGAAPWSVPEGDA